MNSSQLSLHPQPSWSSQLIIPLAWKECESEEHNKPPSWRTLFDPYHKYYASHFLWKAQHIRDELQDDPLFLEYSPRDKRQLEATWLRLYELAQNYEKMVSNSKKKKAKELAGLIALTSQSLATRKRGSDLKAKETILLKKKAKQDSPCFKTILSKQIIQAKILVKGKEFQDCNISRREGVLRAVIAWLDGCFVGRHPEKRIFWLHGERNCGKSIITHYIAKLCDDQHALAAGYVFQDGFNESKWPGLTGTFASDFIAHFGIAYRASLIEKAEALTCDVNDFLAQPPGIQFEYLLTGAWKDIAEGKRQPMIMVLDDLDRCDDWTIRYICDLIQVSISKKANMPVYWLVSSCDTPYIRDHMVNGQLSPHVVSFTLPLYEPADASTHEETDDPPETPRPSQSFNVKTPTATTFNIPTGHPQEELGANEGMVVPLISAAAALYGHDNALRRTESEDSSSSILEWQHLVVESDEE
ncbi:hypothetical protein BKA70DRAFT_1569362 [Coprinopsis sp. MPI-PUGE-AT-0042]|nr:hypothetical protein BKA70DRAFT_1569362 [Coprinopsis sp. MPI-PUGE-AT-0042]